MFILFFLGFIVHHFEKSILSWSSLSWLSCPFWNQMIIKLHPFQLRLGCYPTWISFFWVCLVLIWFSFVHLYLWYNNGLIGHLFDKHHLLRNNCSRFASLLFLICSFSCLTCSFWNQIAIKLHQFQLRLGCYPTFHINCVCVSLFVW